MPTLRLTTAIAALLASIAVLVPAGTAGASSYQRCRSADLRFPFMPGGHKDFGVFRLRIDGGSCAKAHRVAKAWMDEFESHKTEIVLPRKVLGFRFKDLPPTAAQTFNERGRKGSTTIRFDYRVPNG